MRRHDPALSRIPQVFHYLHWGQDIGFIAQEVQSVIPEIVKEVDGLNGKESHLTVNYAAVVPVLVESIKTLKEEIDNIKENCKCLKK